MKKRNLFISTFIAVSLVLSGISAPMSSVINALDQTSVEKINSEKNTDKTFPDDISGTDSMDTQSNNDNNSMEESNSINSEKAAADSDIQEEDIHSDKIMLLNSAPVAKVGNEEFSSLYEAVQKISGSDNKTASIQLIADSQETEKIIIPDGVNITITGDSQEHTITLVEKKGIKIESGASLKIDGNLHFLNAKIVNCGSLILDNGILDMDGKEINTGSSEDYLGFISTYGKDAKFTMNGGTVTNGKIASSYGGVRVSSGGEFVMNGGTISKFYGKGTSSSAVLVYGCNGWLGNGPAKFVMNGGTICDNENYRGGGVCITGNTKGKEFRASMIMNGGTIKNNKATGWIANGNDFSSAGGGLLVQGNAEAIMNDGNITGNTALDGMGGAVAILENNIKDPTVFEEEPTVFEEEPTVFEMNGGTISGNKAIDKNIPSSTGFGGGIYIYSKDVTINGGTIENNEASHQGGGIYVSASGYKLYLYDAVIKNNEASILGGGYWTCPSGNSEAFISDGMAIYDNTSNGIGDDFVSVRFPWFTYVVTLPDRILGGGQIKWYKDGALSTIISDLGEIDKNVPRYDASKENEAVKSITNSKDKYSLKAVVSDNAKKLAEEEAKVLIQNNKAERGGGVATNGDVSIGDRNVKPYTLRVTKVWQDTGDTLKEPVTVYLKVGDIILDSVNLSAENNWTADFTGLPDPSTLSDGHSYSVIENPVPENFIVEYSDMSIDKDKQLLNIDVTNTYHYVPVGSLIITKKVNGDQTDKEKEFTFNITLDNKDINGKYGDVEFVNGIASVKLKDSESVNITGLPDGVKYEVKEADSDNDDYIVTSNNASGVIKDKTTISVEFINNKKTPSVDPDVPSPKPDVPPYNPVIPDSQDNDNNPDGSGDTDSWYPEDDDSDFYPDDSGSWYPEDDPDYPDEDSEDSYYPESDDSYSDGSDTQYPRNSGYPAGDSSNVPETGDNPELRLWLSLLVISSGALAILYHKRKELK